MKPNVFKGGKQPQKVKVEKPVTSPENRRGKRKSVKPSRFIEQDEVISKGASVGKLGLDSDMDMSSAAYEGFLNGSDSIYDAGSYERALAAQDGAAAAYHGQSNLMTGKLKTKRPPEIGPDGQPILKKRGRPRKDSSELSLPKTPRTPIVIAPLPNTPPTRKFMLSYVSEN